jgi:ketosteroid isomerase-like protein
MQRDGLDVLRRLFELFCQREMDWDAVAEIVDPDIVWEVRADFPDAGVYTGVAGMRELSDAFDEAVEQTWYRPLEFIEAGDRMVVPLRWGGLGVGSGAAFAEREETWVFGLRDGRIRHVAEYASREAALEAAGRPG